MELGHEARMCSREAAREGGRVRAHQASGNAGEGSFAPTLSVCNTDSLGEQSSAVPGREGGQALNTVNADVMVTPGERARLAYLWGTRTSRC